MVNESFTERLAVMNQLWQRYLKDGKFEQFIEFIVAVNSLVESFSRLRMSGLVRLCEGLESAAFAMLATENAHPISDSDARGLQGTIDALNSLVKSLSQSQEKRLNSNARTLYDDAHWIKPRSVLVVSDSNKFEVANELKQQMSFFGFKIEIVGWAQITISENAPLAVIFMCENSIPTTEQFSRISDIRQQYISSQIFYLSEPLKPEDIVKLMRAGVDTTVPIENYASMMLSRILDLVQTENQEKSQVLIVEDSRVALTSIERTLAQHGIDSFSINSPDKLFDALEVYKPDLILMDMHMPKFNGVEATRVLRQTEAYATIPIVYLSAESEVSMQVEALRLGGDQFLMKPFNPVLLAAVVEAKVARFREMQRSTQIDSLTGLLNHASSKTKLAAMLRDLGPGHEFSVIMLDIDHFKSINDSYGHPVGDVVIRTLAYLLKGRLRSVDLVGRYGGEEYIIGLPGIGADKAADVMNQIRLDFAQLPQRYFGGVFYTTFSAGASSYPHFDSAETLIEAADNALFQAKRLGRNRIEKQQA